MSNGTSDSDPTAFRPDTDWEALARYLAGESPADEAEAIRRQLDQRPADAAMLAALDKAAARLAFEPPADLDVESALRQVKLRRDAPDILPFTPRVARQQIGRPATRWRVLLPAVAAVTILAVGLAVWRSERQGVAPAASATTIATGVGERDSLRLADGTLVLLAPDSRVEIAADYGQSHRTVDLHGEAFFDVTHDDTHPFIVRAGDAAIRDIGTAFAVRERGDDSVIVVVTTGSVLMRAVAAGADSGIVLHAGDRGRLGSDGRVIAQRGGADSATVAWTRGTLVFRNATMPAVADELRRWFGVELRIVDSSLAGRRLSATFSSESADQVLEVIRMALGAELERKGDTVLVRTAVPKTRP